MGQLVAVLQQVLIMEQVLAEMQRLELAFLGVVHLLRQALKLMHKRTHKDRHKDRHRW